MGKVKRTIHGSIRTLNLLKKIDRMAEKLGLSRSQLMRNLMESAYEGTF